MCPCLRGVHTPEKEGGYNPGPRLVVNGHSPIRPAPSSRKQLQASESKVRAVAKHGGPKRGPVPQQDHPERQVQGIALGLAVGPEPGSRRREACCAGKYGRKQFQAVRLPAGGRGGG